MHSENTQGEVILDVMLLWLSLALPAMGFLFICGRKEKEMEALVVSWLCNADRLLQCKEHSQVALMDSDVGPLSSPPMVGCDSPSGLL